MRRSWPNMASAIKFSLVISLTLSVSACSGVRYAGGNSDVQHRVESSSNMIDSTTIYVRDSVIIRQGGDTVRVEIWKVSYRDRVVVEKDTVIRVDSVSKESPVLVDKPLSPWQGFQIWCGRIALALIGVGIILIVLKRYLKLI